MLEAPLDAGAEEELLEEEPLEPLLELLDEPESDFDPLDEEPPDEEPESEDDDDAGTEDDFDAPARESVR